MAMKDPFLDGFEKDIERFNMEKSSKRIPPI